MRVTVRNMVKPTSQTTAVRVERKLLDRLRPIAKARRRSLCFVVGEAIADYLLRMARRSAK